MGARAGLGREDMLVLDCDRILDHTGDEWFGKMSLGRQQAQCSRMCHRREAEM